VTATARLLEVSGAFCATLCYMASRKKAMVGVRELRQNLSVYLDQVKRGKSLLVTEHGRTVAELRPAAAATDIIERLARDGLATRATRRPANLPEPVRIRSRRSLQDILDELREERL